MKPFGFKNNPPYGPFDKLMVLSLSKDFDCGFFKPPLRVSPEQGAKHRVEACGNATHVAAGAYE